eukprot:g4456.t1
MSQRRNSAGKPWSGFQFIRGDALLTLSELTRQQDCRGALVNGEDVEHPLLVSHRWTAAEHPDPGGIQLRALQRFVSTLADTALVFFASAEEQRRAVPTLAQHGVLQAAILAGRFICSHNIPRDRNSFLRDLGVWYDFGCLPQKPRNDAEQRIFKTSLENLPDLFRSAPVLSLRQNDRDDYMSRGWCLAEVASANLSDFTPLSLYVDEQGQEIGFDKLKVSLASGAATGYNAWVRPAAKRALKFVDGWGEPTGGIGSDNDSITASRVCTREMCTSQADKCELDSCCLHGNFGVWCTHSLSASQALLLARDTLEKKVIAAAEVSAKLGVVVSIFSPSFTICGDIGDMLESLDEIETPFDAGELLKANLEAKQIFCTNGADLVMVGAWLLRCSSAAEPSRHDFFVKLHERVLAGKSLRVVRIDLWGDGDFDADGQEEVIRATYEDDEVDDGV